jgi:hypothetical protein
LDIKTMADTVGCRRYACQPSPDDSYSLFGKVVDDGTRWGRPGCEDPIDDVLKEGIEEGKCLKKRMPDEGWDHRLRT